MGFLLIVMESETRTLYEVVISARGGEYGFPEVAQGMSYSDRVSGRILSWTTGSREVVTKQHKPTHPVAC
jgi:hypothetical protein